jgi:hypothetical protein
MEDRKLSTIEAAERAGVKPSTWRAWRSHGRPHPVPAPEPDGWRELQRPWWWQSTIDAWLRSREQAQQEPL